MRNPETRGYVTWRDVMDVWRWFELGYGVTIELATLCRCPVGEQHNKMYIEARVRTADGAEVALSTRALVTFPSSQYSTQAGAFLGLLYKLDSILARNLIWAEPAFGKAPARAAATA